MMAQLDADMEATIFPELRELAEMPDADTKTMHNLCNYINWAKANSLELAFTLTETQANQCNVSFQRKEYAKYDGTKE